MRSAKDDLATCDKATPGPWIVMPEKCGPDGQTVYQEESLGPICDVGDPYPRGDNHPTENMHFIAMARTALPYWIRRAMEAEELYEIIKVTVNGVAALLKREKERADAANARIEKLERGLQRIAALPPEQKIYCKNGSAGLKKYEHGAVKIARELLGGETS